MSRFKISTQAAQDLEDIWSGYVSGPEPLPR